MSDHKRNGEPEAEVPVPPELDEKTMKAHGIIAAHKLYGTHAIYYGAPVVLVVVMVFGAVWIASLKVDFSVKVALVTPQLLCMMAAPCFAYFLRNQFNAQLIVAHASKTTLYTSAVRAQLRTHKLMLISAIGMIVGFVLNWWVTHTYQDKLSDSEYWMCVLFNIMLLVLTLFLCFIFRNREDGIEHYSAQKPGRSLDWDGVAPEKDE